jgi:hypothetical protein
VDEGGSDAVGAAGARWRWSRVAAPLGALIVGIAVFAFYLPVYRVGGYQLPVGFDASWYVWRAQFVAARGIGPLGTSSRPGHAILSALLEAVTGRTQLQLAVLLPLVLAAVFALAVGAFARSALRLPTLGAAVVVVVAGTVLGTTRLVGENVANLLLVALVVAALTPLGHSVEERTGRVGAVVLLVGAGLAHWVFLGVIVAILGLAVVFALPRAVRDHAAGRSWWASEPVIVAEVVGVAAVAMAVVIGVVLRAPVRTFEVREDPDRFVPKLRTDLRRLVLPVVAPIVGVGAWLLSRSPRAADPSSPQVGRGHRSGEPDPNPDGSSADRVAVERSGNDAGRFARRVLLAWTVVCAAGIVFGAVARALPPHRFLALLVAVPVAVAAGVATVWAARWVGARAGRWAAVAVAVVAVAALAVPGALAWYRSGPGVWMETVALDQARAAGTVLEDLPEDRPFVVLVGPFGRAGVLSVPLKERTIRVGLPPERQTGLHLFVGEPEDLLADRCTSFEGPKTEAAAEPYCRDVLPVLRDDDAPVLMLRAFAPKQVDRSVRELGAVEVAPGVAVLRPGSLRGGSAATPAPEPPAVLTIERSVLWGAAILVLLGLAGWGWTLAFLGRGVGLDVVSGLAPAVGAGVLMLGGVLPATFGLPLRGPVGVATYLAVTLVGVVVAVWTVRRPAPAGGYDAERWTTS